MAAVHGDHDPLDGVERKRGVSAGSSEYGSTLENANSNASFGARNGNGATSEVRRKDIGHDSGKKPSLGDKLNPKVDADRDGKAGILD